jgi:hypothetical protein
MVLDAASIRDLSVMLEIILSAQRLIMCGKHLGESVKIRNDHVEVISPDTIVFMRKRDTTPLQ